MIGGSFSRWRVVVVATVVLSLFLTTHLLYTRAPISRLQPPQQAPIIADEPALFDGDPTSIPPCAQLPHNNDVVVVMRTGATEIRDKLPMHLNTTFRCYPDTIIFSDFAENFMGHEVHDVLASVDRQLMVENFDFELYLRLQREGRQALRPGELSGAKSSEGSKSGKKNNVGWRLDKWKFLPMMPETLKLRPDKNWYIFVESDTYVVWSNMVKWLQKLDPSEPIYAGSENQIGDDVFAHGGSAFVMSRPAVERGAATYTAQTQEWHDLTARYWAGDCVLGVALRQSGVPLTWTWPMLQGGQPNKMDFKETKGKDKSLWCLPALSYHHLSPPDLRNLWNFEQRWITTMHKAPSLKPRWWPFGSNPDPELLRHRDLFRNYVLPNMSTSRTYWTNLSDDPAPRLTIATLEQCKDICLEDPACLQYSVGLGGCMKSDKVMLGEPAEMVRSGWVLERIDEWMQERDKCRGHVGWTVP